jgi:tRNA threonylcarbamoyladenosine biosynthesis protein TsaB
MEGHICCCMDARRKQVYNAVFLAEKGELTRVCEDRAISLEELQEELLSIDGPIYLVGDGAELTMRTLGAEVPGLILPPEHRRHQRASGVALAAIGAMERGESADGAALQPNYLRLSQAERERMEKLRKNNE